MNPDKLLTQKEVADRLGFSVEWIRKLRREGKMQGYRLGHKSVRIWESELRRFIREAKQ